MKFSTRHNIPYLRNYGRYDIDAKIILIKNTSNSHDQILELFDRNRFSNRSIR